MELRIPRVSFWIPRAAPRLPRNSSRAPRIMPFPSNSVFPEIGLVFQASDESSEKCQEPQPPLLLKKVLQYTSNLYCNTPPILHCSAFGATELSGKGGILQYSSHLYRSTPPICVAVRLPFVSQYASHSYRNAFGKILVVVVTGMFPNNCTSSKMPFRACGDLEGYGRWATKIFTLAASPGLGLHGHIPRALREYRRMTWSLLLSATTCRATFQLLHPLSKPSSCT